MWKFAFLIATTALGWVNGASLIDLERTQGSLQDVKDYIQPIIYKELLQAPGDSAVVKQAKTFVSQYLVDALIDNQQQRVVPDRFARQATSNSTFAIPTLRPVLNLLPTRRATPAPQHVIYQVDQILNNVNGGNITGIVDQALLINTSPPVRQLVNGIMSLVLCNPFNRLWNRCYGGGGIFGRRLN